MHRLVAQAFLPNVVEDQVNHKDLNKKNNTLVNLEWVTARENHHHARQALKLQGCHMGRKALLTEQQVKAIREDNTSTIQELADWYKTSKVTIHAVRGFKGAYSLTTPKTDAADFEPWSASAIRAAEAWGEPTTEARKVMDELELTLSRFDK